MTRFTENNADAAFDHLNTLETSVKQIADMLENAIDTEIDADAVAAMIEEAQYVATIAGRFIDEIQKVAR